MKANVFTTSIASVKECRYPCLQREAQIRGNTPCTKLQPRSGGTAYILVRGPKSTDLLEILQCIIFR